MQFRDFLEILLKQWKIIVASFVLVVAATTGVTLSMTPVYEARARVFLSTSSGGFVISEQDLNTYLELLQSPVVLDPLREEVGIEPGTPFSVSGSASSESNILTITATAPTGQLAAEIANAAAPQLAAIGGDFSPLLASAGQRVESTTIQAAGIPGTPVSPNILRNVALAVLAGLALGMGLALLRHALDTRIRTEADVRAITQQPVLAALRRMKNPDTAPLVVESSPHSLAAEEIRRLRTNLQFVDVAIEGRHSFVITSSMPSEGKTLTAVNLAIAMAQGGSRVLLVDADLRHPSVANTMGLEGSVGLTTILLGRASVNDVAQRWGDTTLHVLPAGEIPPNPSELLGSTAMKVLFEEFLRGYDFVLVDSPPILPVIDPVLINRLVGGMLVVACVNRTKKRDLAHALKHLKTVDIEPAGIALNMVLGGDGYGRYGSYYAYGTSGGKGDRPRRRDDMPPAALERLPGGAPSPAVHADASPESSVDEEPEIHHEGSAHGQAPPAVAQSPIDAGSRRRRSRLDEDPLAFAEGPDPEPRLTPRFPPVRK